MKIYIYIYIDIYIYFFCANKKCYMKVASLCHFLIQLFSGSYSGETLTCCSSRRSDRRAIPSIGGRLLIRFLASQAQVFQSSSTFHAGLEIPILSVAFTIVSVQQQHDCFCAMLLRFMPEALMP